jgi:hypothetical protein
MTEQLRQHGITYKICDSIPFLGKPITLVFDHTQDAISEHGFVVGSVKGVLVGLIIAIVMITSVEAATAVFDVVREEVRLRWTAPMIAARRQAAEDRTIEYSRLHQIHLGPHPEITMAPVSYYAIDRFGHADILRHDRTPWDIFELLNDYQHKAVTSSQLESLPAGSQITLFYFNPSASVAVTEAFPGKGKCVLAALDGNVILIPLASYKTSGLPMKGDISHDDE